MKFLHVIIFTFSFIICDAARLGGKGNMRGVVTQYSGLSPKQMMLFKIMLKLHQNSKYGRFA